MNNLEVKTELVEWSAFSEVLTSIRKVVFIDEQKVPEELEMDGKDLEYYHFLATINDIPIACCRVTKTAPAVKLGRMAVLQNYRSNGTGSKMLASVESLLKTKGVTTVNLSAQVHAVPFYTRNNYQGEGEVFVVAGIDHLNMSKSL